MSMKIYCLEVDPVDFEYGEIDQTVVVAKDEDQAIDIAMTQRDALWNVTSVIDTVDAPPQLITSYIRKV